MTTHDNSKMTDTRRKLFGKTIGVAATTAAMLFSTASWAESVTVASWGGAYQAAQSAAPRKWVSPLSKKLSGV